jgi:integrase
LYLQAGKQPRFVRRILGYWKETPVAEITAGAIRQSAVTLYPDATGATRNRQVIVPTQAIVNHAAESELCQNIRVKRFPVETKVGRPATWAWVRAFMSASSAHLGALACFMFTTRARISEALTLRWEDVDFGLCQAKLRQTKVSSERLAHLPPALMTAIANIPGPREGKVFRYSSRDTAKPPWRNACKRAGIEQLSFHSCRHGFATGLLDMGVSPITVAKRGGWKDARHVFETYGHDVASATVTDLLTSTKSAQSGSDDVQKVKQDKAAS